MNKLPPIIVLPFVLAACIIFFVVYIVCAMASLFLWGKPAKIVDDFLNF